MKEGSVLPNKILVKEVKPEEKKTQSGILLPAVGKNPQTHGIVQLVGCGTPQKPMQIQPGQTVLYTPLSGQRFVLNEEELVLLDQDSVLFYF